MILLQAEGGCLHQSALARQLGINKSNVSRLIQQLITKGHVVVASSPEEDARIKRVRLTAKGRRLATQVDGASQQRFAELFASISPGRRKQALQGLEILVGAIESSLSDERNPE